ncbi:hypothetical protein BV20DRAFT_462383 [Pilatotrama ljubarskyi]|nr:hypothetical protein BV20DRAFT_462383 [Pilatotrama ljubarskyi]
MRAKRVYGYERFVSCMIPMKVPALQDPQRGRRARLRRRARRGCLEGIPRIDHRGEVVAWGLVALALAVSLSRSRLGMAEYVTACRAVTRTERRRRNDGVAMLHQPACNSCERMPLVLLSTSSGEPVQDKKSDQTNSGSVGDRSKGAVYMRRVHDANER